MKKNIKEIDFKEKILKISLGKRNITYLKSIRIFIFFKNFLNKSWGNCSYWIYCSFYILWGPFILKLIPNIPSPASLGITISPINGILEINLFNVFAGTKVPLKLI